MPSLRNHAPDFLVCKMLMTNLPNNEFGAGLPDGTYLHTLIFKTEIPILVYFRGLEMDNIGIF
jgi:hypothetical protein